MATNLKDTLKRQFASAKDAQSIYHASWDDRENLAFTKLANKDQNNRKSRLSLGDLSTIVFERSGRTVAQLPSGKFRPESKTDEKYAKLLQLAIERHVIPNANDQFSLPIKMFLTDYLSDLYGGIDVLSYWKITKDYVGPDCQILLPRNVFWQSGKRSKRSAEYVFVSTFVSMSWLLDQKKHKTWKSDAINRIQKQVKDNATKPSSRDDATRQTVNETTNDTSAIWGDTQEIELVTKYEKSGRWITFCPDFDCEIVRNIPSQEFPVISKEPLLPMLDTIRGQGAFERGETLQKTIDSVTNLTHDALKYSIFPIQKYNGSAVKRSTLKWQPGAFWNMTDLNAVGVHNIGSSSLNTFLPIQQFLTAKMLNQNGTTSTQISETDKVSGYGKTPEALKAQQAREATMDRIARDRMEAFWGELINHWATLLIAKQEKTVEFYIYDDEINGAKEAGIEVEVNKGAKEQEDQSENEATRIVFGSGKITIPKNEIKGKFRYYVDPSSSMLKDDSEEHDRLTEVLSLVLKVGPDALNQILANDTMSISVGNLFKRWLVSGGTKDWDDIIKNQPAQSLQPDMSQMMPSQMPQVPPQIPPQMSPQMPQAMPQQQQMPQDQFQPDPQTLAIMEQIRQGGF